MGTNKYSFEGSTGTEKYRYAGSTGTKHYSSTVLRGLFFWGELLTPPTVFVGFQSLFGPFAISGFSGEASRVFFLPFR